MAMWFHETELQGIYLYKKIVLVIKKKFGEEFVAWENILKHLSVVMCLVQWFEIVFKLAAPLRSN